MAALFSNGENVTSGSNLDENVIHVNADGTRSTVKTEIDEINNNLSHFQLREVDGQAQYKLEGEGADAWRPFSTNGKIDVDILSEKHEANAYARKNADGTLSIGSKSSSGITCNAILSPSIKEFDFLAIKLRIDKINVSNYYLGLGLTTSIFVPSVNTNIRYLIDEEFTGFDKVGEYLCILKLPKDANDYRIMVNSFVDLTIIGVYAFKLD